MGIDRRVKQDLYFICEVAVSPQVWQTYGTRKILLGTQHLLLSQFVSFVFTNQFLYFVKREREKRESVHTHTHTHTHTYISDCVEIVCELLLLQTILP
jgi:hypothetical protein